MVCQHYRRRLYLSRLSAVRLNLLAAVLVALVATGAVSASLGGAPKQRAITRNIIGGSLALGITYAIGHLVGAAIT